MRILIVEDEVRLSRHIASALTVEGHDPVVIPDGETALGRIEAEHFDLVFARYRFARHGWIRSPSPGAL